MSVYEDEDRYYCGSGGSCSSEGGAHDVNDAFLERSDRESREEGLFPASLNVAVAQQ